MSDDIRFLMTAPNEPLARMWEEILQEAGIPALVRPGGPGAGAWGSVATFEHGIFRPRAGSGAAREIVAAEVEKTTSQKPSSPGSQACVSRFSVHRSTHE